MNVNPRFDQDDRYVLGEIHSDVKALLLLVADHSSRLVSLERHRWYQRGFLIGIGGLLVSKFPFLSEYFK